MSDTKTPTPVHPLLEGTTPGPWQIEPEFPMEVHAGALIATAEDILLSEEVAMANAKLIAMTPTLTEMSDKPYTAYKSAVDPKTWLVRYGTTGRVYEYPTPIQAANACDALNEAYSAGQASPSAWIKCEDRLPPIHEEPFPEEGFVLILFQCEDWPGKYKTMKASRTIGDWAEDGSPLWFWTDEEGEIIDDDDNLITHWQPIQAPPIHPN